MHAGTRLTPIRMGPVVVMTWLWLSVEGSGQQVDRQRPDRFREMNYVVVSPQGPQDGGDYGPGTPGTKTSGIQEALDFAKAHRKDVYIAGGTMPKAFANGVVYNISETLRIPWFQDFRLDGGEYVLNATMKTGDVVVIDSQMSCRMKFGLIVSPSDGAVVRFRPQTKGPDNFAVITASTFEFNALVGAGSVFPDGRRAPKGVGLYLDASDGPILNNTIYATEIIACEKGLYMSCGPEGEARRTAIIDNWIEVPFAHLCGTHIQIGDGNGAGILRNTLKACINGENVPDNIGVRIFGRNNLLTLSFVQTAPQRNIVFEPPARDNLLTVLELPNGFTNHAGHPTNRIQLLKPMGFSVVTPAVPPSGTMLVNREPFTIEVIVLTPGVVTDWTLKDGSGAAQKIPAALTGGQRIVLEPGDAVSFEYTQGPTWRWRALR